MAGKKTENKKAQKAEPKVDTDYRKTETYKKMSGSERKELERYKRENKITDEHLYLLLYRQDLRNIPKEEKQKGNHAAELLVISGIIVFLTFTATNNRKMLPFAACYVIIVAVIYFSGLLNPYSRTLSNVNKLLKKLPEVPSFEGWFRNSGSADLTEEEQTSDSDASGEEE